MGTVVLADVSELTTVKISELDETLSTGNDDDVPIVKDSKTQRVKKPNLVHTQNTDTALGPQSENLDMNTHKIINVVDPIDDQDAITKLFAANMAINGGVF